MTKLITAAEITLNHVLVSKDGKVGIISSIQRGSECTVIRVNGQLIAPKNGRKLRVKA